MITIPLSTLTHGQKLEMTLTTGSPLVVFHEEIRPAPAADGATKGLVSQRADTLRRRATFWINRRLSVFRNAWA